MNLNSKVRNFQIGNYDINKKIIGKGSFSKIYKGVNIISKREVAIKEITLEVLNKNKKMIQTESKIMLTLNHPNIVRLHDTIIDHNTNNIYLVMDYYKRGDFSKFLKKRPLKEKYAIKYLKNIANGLKYLIDQNIVHRDLKPQNLLMTDTGELKITDFGFARYFQEDIMIQTICGSPLYMAPEIIKNEKYDFRSDLWSVGIILYEMVVGKTPFNCKNIYELVRCIENKNIVIDNKYNLSINCKNLIHGLLKKNPNERLNWDEFFTHNLLKNTNIFEENKLLEFDSLSNIPKIPIKDNFFLENNNSSLISLNSLQSSDNNLFDNELKFNFDIDDNPEKEDSDSENEIFYDSCEEIINNRFLMSENFMKIDIREDYFKSTMSLENNIKDSLLKDYVLIEKKYEKKTLSQSLKKYLGTSLNILKESYNYISNYNSI